MRRLLELLRSFCHYLGQADRWHRPASGDNSDNRSHHMMVWANFIVSLGTKHSCRPTCHANTVDLLSYWSWSHFWVYGCVGAFGWWCVWVRVRGAGGRVPGLKQGRSYSCTSQGLMRVRMGPCDAMWLNLDLEGDLDPWWPTSKWHLPKRNTLQLRLINLL